MNAGKKQGGGTTGGSGAAGGVVLFGKGVGDVVFSFRGAEINHGAGAIMCNSTPARLVTLVT